MSRKLRDVTLDELCAAEALLRGELVNHVALSTLFGVTPDLALELINGFGQSKALHAFACANVLARLKGRPFCSSDFWEAAEILKRCRVDEMVILALRESEPKQ